MPSIGLRDWAGSLNLQEYLAGLSYLPMGVHVRQETGGGSLSGDVYAVREIIDRTALLREYYEPFADLSPKTAKAFSPAVETKRPSLRSIW